MISTRKTSLDVQSSEVFGGIYVEPSRFLLKPRIMAGKGTTLTDWRSAICCAAHEHGVDLASPKLLVLDRVFQRSNGIQELDLNFASRSTNALDMTKLVQMACDLGVGNQRTEYEIENVFGIDVADQAIPMVQRWSLAELVSASHLGRTSFQPCYLDFPNGVRLLRNDRLICEPTLADVVASIGRRVASFLPESLRTDWDEHRRELTNQASLMKTSWEGVRDQLTRYSRSQNRRITLRTVRGCIHVPDGLGAASSLVAVGTWLHVGKFPIVLGKMNVR